MVYNGYYRKKCRKEYIDDMREIDVSLVRDKIRDLCIEANHYLGEDTKACIMQKAEEETWPVARDVLSSIQENISIAEEGVFPLCQDTGMACVFLEIGQDVHFTGGSIEEAVHEGVRRGYGEGYLRKAIVEDPLRRVNTGDNTPAYINYDIVPGDKLKITVAPKGFGSENMSQNDDQYYAAMEDELLERINSLGIGPQGFGGKTTALAVRIIAAPTHIAGLPVAVNINCHVSRHKEAII